MEMKKYKLQDLGTIITGKTPSTKQEDNFNGNIPFVTPEDITNNVYNLKKTGRYITEKGFASIKANTISGKSILVGCIGSDMGNVGFINSECATNQQINSITDIKSDFVPEYIYYNLCTKKEFFRKNAGSTTTPLLPKSVFSLLDIFCCDFESQQKISAVLSSLDDKIALNNRINAKLEQMAKRLYDYWFVQFDFPNADGKPYKSTGGKMVWNETLKREIPEGWEVKKLGDLFTTNRGVSYSTKTITGEIGIPMINLASFSPDGSYKIDGIKIYTGEYTEEKLLKPFDLVMCNTQQTAIDFSKDIIGKALLVPDIFKGDITSSHHVNTLKVQNEKLKFYLYRLFNTDYFHAYISHYASGTNIMGLDFAGVENYSAVIPSEEILSKFADFTLDIEKKKSEIIRQNKKLISLRDRLLPLLMNGQVEVR